MTAQAIRQRDCGDLMEKVFKVFESPSFAALPPFHLLALPTQTGAAPHLGASSESRRSMVYRMVVPGKTSRIWAASRAGRMMRHRLDEDVIKAWSRRDSRGEIEQDHVHHHVFAPVDAPTLDPAIAHPDSPDGLKAQSLAMGGACGLPKPSIRILFLDRLCGSTNRVVSRRRSVCRCCRSRRGLLRDLFLLQ